MIAWLRRVFTRPSSPAIRRANAFSANVDTLVRTRREQATATVEREQKRRNDIREAFILDAMHGGTFRHEDSER